MKQDAAYRTIAERHGGLQQDGFQELDELAPHKSDPATVNDLLDRLDEIPGSRLKVGKQQIWLHTNEDVEIWLMGFIRDSDG